MRDYGGIQGLRMFNRRITSEVKNALPKRLLQAGRVVKVDAQKSMRSGGGKGHEPSPKGTPPHVQTGALRASIAYALETTGMSVVVGPTEKYGKVHEFGGRHHPERPFMRPALRRKQKELPLLFGSLW